MKTSEYFLIGSLTSILSMGVGGMGYIYNHHSDEKISEKIHIQRYDGLNQAILGLDKAIDNEIEVQVRKKWQSQKKSLENDLSELKSMSYVKEDLSRREDNKKWPLYAFFGGLVGVYLCNFLGKQAEMLEKIEEDKEMKKMREKWRT